MSAEVDPSNNDSNDTKPSFTLPSDLTTECKKESISFPKLEKIENSIVVINSSTDNLIRLWKRTPPDLKSSNAHSCPSKNINNEADQAERKTNESMFKCSDCKNTYKTANGLQRHLKKKHSASVTADDKSIFLLDKCTIEMFLRKSVDIVVKDECWKKETRKSLSSFNCLVVDELADVINSITLQFSTTNDPEHFFERFYGDVTAVGTDFLKELPLAAANIVMIQLGELVFAHLKKING